MNHRHFLATRIMHRANGLLQQFRALDEEQRAARLAQMRKAHDEYLACFGPITDNDRIGV